MGSSFTVYCKFSADSESEMSLTIGQYLIKLRLYKTEGVSFFGPPCIHCYYCYYAVCMFISIMSSVVLFEVFFAIMH